MSQDEARWLPEPTFERSLAEEKRFELSSKRFGWATAFSMFLCPVWCIGTGPELIPFPIRYPFFAFFISLGCAFEWIRRNNRHSDLHFARQRAMREEFASVDGWLVDLRVIQGTVTTGLDTGVLWFEDDQMLFNGARTSFAISPGMVRVRGKINEPDSRYFIPLKKQTAAGYVSLRLDVMPYVESGLRPMRSENDLARRLSQWTISTNSDQGQWPPLTLLAGSRSSFRLFFRALFATAFLTLIPLYLFSKGLEGVGVFTLLAIVAILSIRHALGHESLWPPVLWRQWRDRRRFDHFARQNGSSER